MKKEKKIDSISTFLGSDASFEGTIEFQGTIRVDGRVKGKIYSEGGTLIVGEKAVVNADIVAGAVIVGLATLASAALVFMLSLRLRRREMETLFKIGGSRVSVGALMASEMVVVLVTGIVFAAALTILTSQFGAALVRALIRM